MHNLGIHMGDKLLPASKHNPKGHFENLEFFQINQEILRSVNSSSSELTATAHSTLLNWRKCRVLKVTIFGKESSEKGCSQLAEL